MNTNFSIQLNHIHLWRAWLPDLAAHEASWLHLLSEDEITRARRFRFPIHKQRFILARALLRQILAVYTEFVPQSIQFTYGSHGKPFLQTNPLGLQFNLSHSHDLVVYAVSLQHEIGVDAEFMEKESNDSLAERFFHPKEYADLCEMPPSERRVAFFRLWSAKEALIKAVGEGLFIGLHEFALSVHEQKQTVQFSKENTNKQFHVENFVAHPNYQSAFATDQIIDKIHYWQWGIRGPEPCMSF